MNLDIYKNSEDFEFVSIDAMNMFPHPFGLTPWHAERNLYTIEDIVKAESEVGPTCGVFVSSNYDKYSTFATPECAYPCQMLASDHTYFTLLVIRNPKISVETIRNKLETHLLEDSIDGICILR